MRNSTYSPLKAEIEAVVGALVGKNLWKWNRAADMAIFHFGERRPTRDFYGKPVEVGEHALHIQCAWRIAEQERVIVGSADLYYPPELAAKDAIAHVEGDWDKGNRRDELLKILFENGTRSFAVHSVEVGLAASLHIFLSDGLCLDVIPDDSLPHEHWRLLRPDSGESDFVVSGQGVER